MKTNTVSFQLISPLCGVWPIDDKSEGEEEQQKSATIMACKLLLLFFY